MANNPVGEHSLELSTTRPELQRRNQLVWAGADALRSNNVDALRFILATIVIFSHSYAFLVGDDHTEPLYRLSRGQRTLGGLAVDFFFVLSGFLITHSWMSSPYPIPFLRKRILRIYPAFIVASLAGVLIFAPLSTGLYVSTLQKLSTPGVISSILTLGSVNVPGAFPNNPFEGVINGSLWSIRYEAWCYLGVMILGMLPVISRSRSKILVLFLFVLLCSIVYDFFDLKMGGGILGRIFGSPTLWMRLLPCFLAGMAFYRFRDAIPWHPAYAILSLLALTVSFLIPNGVSFASPTAGAYLLFSLAFFPWCKVSIASRYGDFSYGMYAYAFPIQQSLVAWLGTAIHPWFLFCISFVATLGVAVLSWHLIEKPALKLKGKQHTSALSRLVIGVRMRG